MVLADSWRRPCLRGPSLQKRRDRPALRHSCGLVSGSCCFVVCFAAESTRTYMTARVNSSKHSSLIPIEKIERAIYFIRGEKVMLDRDLTELYGVETKMLNRAVKRNLRRFPLDFLFQLSAEETSSLRYQIGTSKKARGGRRYLPYVFTEQGVAMLSTALNSERAVLVNIEIMRAFVKLRQMLASNSELSRRLDDLEGKYDRQFKLVFDAIRALMSPPVSTRKQIGFRSRPVKK
jgi:phage regulator Rha-like protein